MKLKWNENEATYLKVMRVRENYTHTPQTISIYLVASSRVHFHSVGAVVKLDVCYLPLHPANCEQRIYVIITYYDTVNS